jgi:hypothetical protein
MIAESIAAYPGHCPCPYNTRRTGSHCGKRSAWSKAGGYAPLCYAQDISDEAVKVWRQQHGVAQWCGQRATEEAPNGRVAAI